MIKYTINNSYSDILRLLKYYKQDFKSNKNKYNII